MSDSIATTDAFLTEAVTRLVATYHPLRIYLFGSKARGDDNEDSDYDLMVVVPDEMPKELRKTRRAYEAMRGTGVAADIIVWQNSDFQNRLVVPTSLPATVMQEGVLLYGE